MYSFNTQVFISVQVKIPQISGVGVGGGVICKTQNPAYAYYLRFRRRSAYKGTAYRIPAKNGRNPAYQKVGYRLSYSISSQGLGSFS